MKQIRIPIMIAVILAQVALLATPIAGADEGLWELCARLREHRFVDLTHTFAPGIPRWEGFPSMEVEALYTYEKGGFFAELFTHVGQYGTHVDPPAHFHKGLRTLDAIPAEEFILPGCVIDVTSKVKKNPDYQLSVEDVKAWEKRNGRVPRGAFVINRSGWSSRWPDPERFLNRDAEGVKHTPGWSLAALKLLFEERGVTAIGHESADTDAGATKVFACETYVLGTDHYQIELLANVGGLPEKGFIVFVGVPKPKHGSGFPARVIAVMEK